MPQIHKTLSIIDASQTEVLVTTWFCFLERNEQLLPGVGSLHESFTCSMVFMYKLSSSQ